MATNVEQCRTCYYFMSVADAIPGAPENAGACRAHPPTPIFVPTGPSAYWPNVNADLDWCGDWRFAELRDQRPMRLPEIKPDLFVPPSNLILP